MFTITYLHQKSESYTPLLSGVGFGKIGLPQYFRVEAPGFTNALEVEFVVLRDKDKKDFDLNIEARGNNGLRVAFFNPTDGGTSGLNSPFGLVILPPSDILGFMFFLDVLRGSDVYRMTYELSHGKLPHVAEGGAK